MKPLLLLVGKNNTGKSYLASLIWALLNIQDTLLSVYDDAPEHTACPDFFEALHKKSFDSARSFSHRVTAKEFSGWLSGRLNEAKKPILSDLFAWPGVSAGEIQLSLPSDSIFDVVREPYDSEKDGRFVTAYSLGQSDDGTRAFNFRYREADDNRWLKRHIVSSFAGLFLNLGRTSRGPATYIPAARTGLLIALKPLVSNLLGDLRWDARLGSRANFPLPIIRFLQTLVDQDSDAVPFTADIADFLEEEILGGHIQRRKGASEDIDYVPNGLKSAMPLYATSSMVTELASFLILLRSTDLSGGLVFEEPEAHLHISAQRTMARAIARLVNRGIPVTVTTHSDTFLQQLNLLITLGSHAKGEELASKYGYTSEDLIHPDDAAAYQFDTYRNRTDVSKVELNEFGFVVPALNEVLEDLTKQVLEVQATE